jgi:hypothetical protein
MGLFGIPKSHYRFNPNIVTQPVPSFSGGHMHGGRTNPA